MKLPNAHMAIVDRRKVIGYLLDSTHPDGASKADFFTQFDFCPQRWETFAESLRKHGKEYPVSKVKHSFFGIRYEVDGELTTPKGPRPRVRTVWQIDHEKVAPRLITAHPLEGQ